MSGSEVGRKVVVAGSMLIGRVSECDVIVDDAEVSREHARLITSADGALSIEDLDSRNGTFVNGTRITSAALQVGDRLQLGSQELLVARYSPVPGQLVERQRFESLGRLAAGIAHDFNNMLAVISASRTVLRDALKGASGIDPVAMECADEIGTAAERARLLASRMLVFARTDDERRQTVDLSSICVELAALLRSSIPRTIAIVCNVDAGLQVVGNAAELHQVVMNLMLNARDAMPDGGELLLTATRLPDLAPPQLFLTISDTGTGIADDVLPQIFEPFFSTKGEHGFGLGLATVRDIVTTHGGSVEVRSRVGAGTTFTIMLPVAKVSAAPRRAFTKPPPSDDATAHILLVDDEPAVRKSMARLLKREGHEVVSAQDGREALRVFSEANVAIDLVLLDYDMPRLNGVLTFHHLRRMDPGARILLCSGHGELPEEKSLREAGLLGVLKKPFSPKELLRVVQAALAPAPVTSAEDTQRETLGGAKSKGSRQFADIEDTDGPPDTIGPGSTMRPDDTLDPEATGRSRGGRRR